jgi:hypothetical protein
MLSLGALAAFAHPGFGGGYEGYGYGRYAAYAGYPLCLWSSCIGKRSPNTKPESVVHQVNKREAEADAGYGYYGYGAYPYANYGYAAARPFAYNYGYAAPYGYARYF